jgi:hypothetical protein
MKKLLALVALLSCNAQAVETVTFDPTAGMVDLLAWQTTVCMDQAAMNALRAGQRVEDDIVTTIATLCGKPLAVTLMQVKGYSREQATLIIIAMAHESIRYTPGVKKPAVAGW